MAKNHNQRDFEYEIFVHWLEHACLEFKSDFDIIWINHIPFTSKRKTLDWLYAWITDEFLMTSTYLSMNLWEKEEETTKEKMFGLADNTG